MALFEILRKKFIRHGGLFITGTDTDVGKTYVGSVLARDLRKSGLDLGVFKPAQSGPGDDIGKLRRAARCRDPLELCNPYRFKAALAPAVAADLEGRKVSRRRVFSCFRRLRNKHEGILVEGAGGLLVPLAGRWLVVDLAAELKLPLVLVARPALGTLNHSLLTLGEARRRGLEVVCVVLNGLKGKPGLAEKTNPARLASLGRVRVAGPLAWGFQSLASGSGR
jgi:dethiobiotin synthetase